MEGARFGGCTPLPGSRVVPGLAQPLSALLAMPERGCEPAQSLGGCRCKPSSQSKSRIWLSPPLSPSPPQADAVKTQSPRYKELPGHTLLPSPALGTSPLLPRECIRPPDKGMPWGLEVILPWETGRVTIIFTFCELKDCVQ